MTEEELGEIFNAHMKCAATADAKFSHSLVNRYRAAGSGTFPDAFPQEKRMFPLDPTMDGKVLFREDGCSVREDAEPGYGQLTGGRHIFPVVLGCLT